MTLQFIHDTHKRNMGDVQSCPLNHFKFNCDTIEIDLISETKKINPNHPIIIGGGGLLQEGKSRDILCNIINSHKSKIIIWGVGLNTNGKKNNDNIPDIFQKADLVGIRDAGFDYENIPCVSCMHPAFDIEYEIENEIVCFQGNKLTIEGMPIMNCVNDSSMNEIIRFLGTAKTVVTSSYHGAYWGALLKREVIVIPNAHSSKFYHFPVPVVIADQNNWMDYVGKINMCNMLNQFRSINISFAKKVSDILGVDVVLK